MTGELKGSSTAKAATGGPNADRVIPLVVEHVAKSYDVGDRVVPVIGDLSLTLDNGQIVSIVGPSGCGKTTLLNTLCGLLTPDTGRISWYGQAIVGQPQNVGYMLQKDLLLPWRTALGNVMLGLAIRGVAANAAGDPRPRHARSPRATRIRRSLPLDALGRHAPARGAGADTGE